MRWENRMTHDNNVNTLITGELLSTINTFNYHRMSWQRYRLLAYRFPLNGQFDYNNTLCGVTVKDDFDFKIFNSSYFPILLEISWLCNQFGSKKHQKLARRCLNASIKSRLMCNTPWNCQLFPFFFLITPERQMFCIGIYHFRIE